MSGRVLEWAVTLDTRLSHATARVLFVLAKHADDDGSNTYPSLDRIQALAQAQRSTVVRALVELQEKGVILKEKGGGRGKSTRYRINLALGAPPETVASGYPLTPENSSVTLPIAPENSSMTHINSSVTLPDSIQTLRKKVKESPVVPIEPQAPQDAAPPAQDQTRPRTERGTRLPDDWQPDPEGAAYASSLGLDPGAVALNFRDYWHSKPGAAGRKVRWDRTWAMWCRTDAERAARKPRYVLNRESAGDRRRRELGLPSIIDRLGCFEGLPQ